MVFFLRTTLTEQISMEKLCSGNLLAASTYCAQTFVKYPISGQTNPLFLVPDPLLSHLSLVPARQHLQVGPWGIKLGLAGSTQSECLTLEHST